jgi:hypothetical protein
MYLTVHNQNAAIELVSPLYFYNCGTYYKYPIKITYAGPTMTTGFRFDPDQDEPGGILMYEVRRSYARSSYQSRIDIIYARAIEEASKMMRLLVAWKIERSGEPKVDVMLVEYNNESVLNEDKLAQLYNKIDSMPSGHNPSEWLMYDNITLEAAYAVTEKKGLELKITASRGLRGAIKSMWIDSERQVLSLMM